MGKKLVEQERVTQHTTNKRYVQCNEGERLYKKPEQHLLLSHLVLGSLVVGRIRSADLVSFGSRAVSRAFTVRAILTAVMGYLARPAKRHTRTDN